MSSWTAHFVKDGLEMGGQTKWPPRSPIIIPLEFFFWDNVKDRLFAIPAQDIDVKLES